MARTFPEALTKEQWYEKLKSWIPEDWYLNNPEFQDAHLWGLAALYAYLDNEVSQTAKETFITDATGRQLDEHGVERTIPRIEDELDAQYRPRLRNITNRSNCPDLKELVDAVLIAGESSFIEDFKSDVFLNREFFYNRGHILVEKIVNVFTILVDKQVHEPFSFFNRGFFANRGDFIGRQTSSDYVFELIQGILCEEKATGTLYRLYERLGS